jgi:hypothetical protein
MADGTTLVVYTFGADTRYCFGNEGMSRNCQGFVIAMTVFRGGIRDGIGIDQTIRLTTTDPSFGSQQAVRKSTDC